MSSLPAKTKTPSLKRDFLIFLSIPLTVIIIVTAILQGPNLFAHPRYNFLYSACQGYSCSGGYAIGQGGVLVYDADANDSVDPPPALYYYNANRNSSQQVTLSDAQKYKLDTANVSPDNYTLWQDTGSSSGFLFEGGTSGTNNYYLKDGMKKKQINIANVPDYSTVQFIGWIQK